MINNFSILRPLFTFDSSDDFYHVQVIKRVEDHLELTNEIIVRSYYIKSIKDFEFLMEEISNLCLLHNARAYVDIFSKSFENVTYQVLKRLSEYILSKSFKKTANIYDTVCGETSNHKNKWMIEINWDDSEPRFGEPLITPVIIDLVTKLQKEIRDEVLVVVLPSNKGVKLITRSFNREALRIAYPNIRILYKFPPITLYAN